MTPLPNLVWLRSFEAAARHGSFTAAATELGLTQAAVSTHIRSLEGQLGHTLFKRTTRAVDLTDIGKAYLPSVRKALQDIASATTGLFGRRTAETVTIRAPISTAALVLAPELPRFLETHPLVSVRLLSAIWADSALAEHVDIDIRQGDGRWPDAKANPLGEDFAVPVCAQEIEATLHAASDLTHMPLIHIMGFEDHWTRFFQSQGLPQPVSTGRITVDTTVAAVEVVRAGVGVALVMERAATRLRDKGLVAMPLECRIPLGQRHYLVGSDRPRRPRRALEDVRRWIRLLLG